MRDDICTIPVTEVFEVNDGCPICRMYEKTEERIVDYIMGSAMMEPDIRILTNKLGFCERHFDLMHEKPGRLQLSLILQSHLAYIEKNVLDAKPSKSNITETCFVCDKIEWGMSRMIETVFRTYEKEEDFRNMFNNQPMFCLKHYEMLKNSGYLKLLKSKKKDFLNNLNQITGNYLKTLYGDISKFASMYDYRNRETNDWGNSKDSIERTIAFLNGKTYKL